MIVKLLTEHHLQFLSLKGGCRGLSESTNIKNATLLEISCHGSFLLQVGDQILDVNGETYLDITHAEAVRVLKLSKHLIFTIKDVGKLPFGRTTIDKTKWLNHRPASQKPKTASQ